MMSTLGAESDIFYSAISLYTEIAEMLVFHFCSEIDHFLTFHAFANTTTLADEILY